MASSKTRRCGPPEQGTRNRQSLLLATGDLHASFAYHCIESLLRACEQRLRRRLPEDIETFLVCRIGAHEQQVLSNRSREQLRVLRHEPDALAQAIEVDDARSTTPL